MFFVSKTAAIFKATFSRYFMFHPQQLHQAEFIAIAKSCWNL